MLDLCSIELESIMVWQLQALALTEQIDSIFCKIITAMFCNKQRHSFTQELVINTRAMRLICNVNIVYQ